MDPEADRWGEEGAENGENTGGSTDIVGRRSVMEGNIRNRITIVG